jgi:hypothetical protein
MRIIVTVLLTVLAPAAAVSQQAKSAQQAKPTVASVRQLFEAMHSNNIVESYMKQVESTMHTALQQQTAGKTPSASQQKIVEDLQGKIMALVKQQLNWAELEPTMIEVYRDTFTQREIDGMLKFYQSEPGKAVIVKLPTVMQESMARMQSRVNALTPKIVQLEKDAAAQIKAAGAAPTPGSQPAQPPAVQPPPAQPPPPKP